MKVRQLKQQLSQAGFSRLKKRGKGSHRIWQHPIAKVKVVQSGHDNKDALPYQVKAVRSALTQINHH